MYNQASSYSSKQHLTARQTYSTFNRLLLEIEFCNPVFEDLWFVAVGTIKQLTAFQFQNYYAIGFVSRVFVNFSLLYSAEATFGEPNAGNLHSRWISILHLVELDILQWNDLHHQKLSAYLRRVPCMANTKYCHQRV